MRAAKVPADVTLTHWQASGYWNAGVIAGSYGSADEKVGVPKAWHFLVKLPLLLRVKSNAARISRDVCVAHFSIR